MSFNVPSSMKRNRYCPQLSALGRATTVTLTGGLAPLPAAPAPLLNDPVDISADFHTFANTLFLADKLVSFAAATALGKLSYQRSVLVTNHAFNNTLLGAKTGAQNEFSATGPAHRAAHDSFAGKVTWSIRSFPRIAKTQLGDPFFL
jgi:hypothetical protein